MFKSIEIKLEPNCLMTVEPILFLRRPLTWKNKDLFIPVYLREHGYEIEVVTLKSYFSSSLIPEITAMLDRFESENKKFHFVVDAKVKEILNQETSSCIQSLTLFSNQPKGLLSRIKELAESDYT